MSNEPRRVLVIVNGDTHVWGEVTDERRGIFTVRLGHKVRYNGRLTDIVQTRNVPVPMFVALCPLEVGERHVRSPNPSH